MIRALLLAGSMLLPASAHAAIITLAGDTVTLSGTIMFQDGEHFQTVTARAPAGARVVLDSLGGNVGAGLNIGREIHKRGFQTVVPANTECASMCGLIWLAGSTRWVGSWRRPDRLIVA